MLIRCNKMLHATYNGIDYFLYVAGEWRSFPAPGVTLDTQAILGSRQTRKPDPVIILQYAIGAKRLTPPHDQMVAVHPNI